MMPRQVFDAHEPLQLGKRRIASPRRNSQYGDMNWKRLLSTTLLVSVISFRLAAQQTETDRNPMAEFWAKAVNGDAKAQMVVGNGFYWGVNGLSQDYEQAASWFKKSADQGYAVAQYNLGICYAKGQGVVSNAADAVVWYRKAAEQNYPQAQNNLGVCYAEGQGVIRDDTEAVNWYRKAAEQNDAKAQYDLATCYYTGRGVTKDLVKAANWFRKAADRNYARAQYDLGVCYRTGQGTPIDYVESYKWYLLAASKGDANSLNALKDLEALLSPEQIQQARELARSFRPQ